MESRGESRLSFLDVFSGDHLSSYFVKLEEEFSEVRKF